MSTMYSTNDEAIDGGTLPGVTVTPPANDSPPTYVWTFPPAPGYPSNPYPSDPGYPDVPIGGGGGGGSTSGSTAVSDIIDKLEDPCFKNALKAVKEGGLTGKMEEIISKLDDDNKIQVSVYQEPSLPGNADGNTTNYLFDRKTKVFTADINLSEDALKSASKEYVAGTILHEAIHAYFAHMRGTDSFNAYSHETMAVSYVEPLAKGLKDLFPNLTDKGAYGLAWGGLLGTVEASKNNMVGQYKMGSTGTYMTRDDIQGVLNGHHFGIAENATKCE